MKPSTPLPIFAYPRLSKTDLLFVRIGGDGLGNLLFKWARCLATAERHGWRMIWPTWQSIKPKNWRVNPYDHRTYFDLFRPTERYVTGWRKPWYLVRYRLIGEQQALAEGAPPGSVVQFQGIADKFAPFLRDQALVCDELLRIARPPHLAALSEPSGAPIAIHVRRGDFVQQASYDDMVNTDNSALPLDWYIAALQAVRAAARRDLPAWVYSDGTTEELAPLLALPAVQRRDYGSGLGDMLGLSRARLLIASGSTFSMWGSFLGQVPTLWHPGKLLQHVLLEAPEKEIEWAPGDALPAWVAML
ncbi:MAG: hypothetical protein R3233_05975 [Xanthomonadales bacterium]|nr:hypothetical protein [Xanthomonadales bacterium]